MVLVSLLGIVLLWGACAAAAAGAAAAAVDGGWLWFVLGRVCADKK